MAVRSYDQWSFVNLGIGIGTDATNAIISSSIRPMCTKLSRVVIYDEGTPPTNSRDTSMAWSREKSKPSYPHNHRAYGPQT